MARTAGEPAAKRTKLDFDSDSDSDSDSGVKLESNFKINEDYAKRFEHNKKREEKHRLEEKYGITGLGKRKGRDEEEDSEEDSEDDESEDDDAALATEHVDQEIFATLDAIKKKDPRVYDANVKFYSEFDPQTATAGAAKKDKPMSLHDYQRERLLSGHTGGEDEQEHVPTFQEEQDQLQRQVIGEMHNAADAEGDDEGDDFMVAKKTAIHDDMPGLPKEKKQKKKKITDEDIKTADKDPETYLSNFMLARAWLPGDGARFDPLESDDSEDDNRADEFETAYNMRFEDPKTANEKLQSFARDVGKYGVRREEKNARARAREREREIREAEKRERDEDKARLRKLKIEEAEEKVKRIKEAAGLRGKALDLDEWRDVIDGDFDDSKWDEVLKKRFGDDYYNEDDAASSADEGGESTKRKPKKPKWDDDIDIDDLVPDFDKTAKPAVALSDLEDDDAEGGAPLPAAAEDSDDEEATSSKKKKIKTDREKEKSDAKRAARIEKKKIEDLVDSNLTVQDPTLTSGAPAAGFRYRETSPTNFGLTARDILFADDSQLNQWAGIKKLHAFRDGDRKKKDKKKLSKKARLKQWRKETFGKADEPTGGFETILGGAGGLSGANAVEVEGGVGEGNGNITEGARKRKRKGKKAKGAEA
ncbi:hypothetical protein CLAFUW4_01971 [Fulvia fulva]|uniref:Kri1-like C-terminal domain-containing protein n=1 Tax=Passalora fulva TaxID=5499 RepID=A0A9Q8L7P5_PASFU|nr:uncharacterized protein CLAFUR5_01965 [Fulvia fulva]KAK4634093.1 hypothetical protein CLAFUR4_01966 [Fulvia fulva]KAK4637579.1 hypothetical protein CLAFUR0_01968 [Fulvia fulva]UJO12378.1 hypothetical protein CLAFUR5_01965 [Fulvia fulva]WPV09673.1 hypothetical protein CLAFUW4_01971 [Fulvia fulva]WPV23740.1 hypothetical protein CLAFUW7_01971 [Fulvia fulva]